MNHKHRRLAIAALPWLLIAGGLVVAYGLFATLADNLADRNIRPGFGFLFDRAGFAIGETLIAYAPGDSYAAALAVGLLNTRLISAPRSEEHTSELQSLRRITYADFCLTK